MFPLLLLAAAAAQPCPTENARYVLRADPSITAEFHAVPKTADWWNGIAMKIHFGKSGRDYWWLAYQGGTSDNQGFRWTALKGTPEAAADYKYRLGDLLYFAFEGDYSMRDDSARAGQPAPAHFMLYNMREAFWSQTDGDKREATPRSLFDLAGCEADAPGATPDVVFPIVP